MITWHSSHYKTHYIHVQYLVLSVFFAALTDTVTCAGLTLATAGGLSGWISDDVRGGGRAHDLLATIVCDHCSILHQTCKEAVGSYCLP